MGPHVGRRPTVFDRDKKGQGPDAEFWNGTPRSRLIRDRRNKDDLDRWKLEARRTRRGGEALR